MSTCNPANTGSSYQSSVEETGGFFRDYQCEIGIREKVDSSKRKVALAEDFLTFFFEWPNFIYRVGQLSNWTKTISVDDLYRFG